MKKLFLVLCVALLGVACRASGASMSDTSCTDPNCAECSKEKKESCTDCQQKCDAEQTCPVTGKSLN